ncbi:hypothetical protein QP162_15360 [Sphingomonas aurantiaca]|uniref:hypothetical protein n=1 Tax=Sphingomonas aurantiaca TaxID=185949 RepID=UPI002FE37269
MSVNDLALMLETVPGVSAHRRAEWLTMIETGVEDISVYVALALHDTIAIDLRILAYWMAIAEGAKPYRIGTMPALLPMFPYPQKEPADGHIVAAAASSHASRK